MSSLEPKVICAHTCFVQQYGSNPDKLTSFKNKREALICKQSDLVFGFLFY
jgi:hypothetical protein